MVTVDRDVLKSALARVSILSNEKYHGARFHFKTGELHVAANNPEQEEAEEEITVDYNGEELEVGFNVSYFLEALSTVPQGNVKIILSDSNSSALIQSSIDENSLYVIMPLRL